MAPEPGLNRSNPYDDPGMYGPEAAEMVRALCEAGFSEERLHELLLLPIEEFRVWFWEWQAANKEEL